MADDETVSLDDLPAYITALEQSHARLLAAAKAAKAFDWHSTANWDEIYKQLDAAIARAVREASSSAGKGVGG